MLIRSVFVCGYLAAAYWLSHHIEPMKMAFYPTLGAFCFLFMKKRGQIPHSTWIVIGATASSAIGSLLYRLDSGEGSFLITTFITITLIHLCKWDAAPIMAVSLIPYFAHPASFWILPVAVFLSLSGLLLPLWLMERLDRSGLLASLDALLLRLMRGKTKVQRDYSL